MSASLTLDDIQPVADLLDRLQNVQRAVRDLHEAHEENREFSCEITARSNLHSKDQPVAHTHRLSYWVVLQGLAAMERELLSQLRSKEITVESALPMGERK